ncbi:MAG: hypothetical protein K0R55_981 [Sporomusa sp.]|jgi:NADH dehydrogenase FAD-containing subunit|nr:hypothetical protein [Sporomusa sp.]
MVKKLETGVEEAIPYDKLVIATGASAIKPSLPGVSQSLAKMMKLLLSVKSV